MKTLFVSMVAFDNNTSATIQNKGIIKGFFDLGHEIDIMTLKPNKNSISYDDSINDIYTLISQTYYIELNPKYAVLMAKKQKTNENNNSDKIVESTSSKLFKRLRNILKKMYNNLSIFDGQKSNVNQVSNVKVAYEKYDVIISASDPKSSHLIVDRIYKENPTCKAKWLQYWGDPMFNDITRKKDWRDKLVKYQEKRLIKKADKVIYASPLTLRLQRKTFPKFTKKMNYASQVYANILNENITQSEKRLNEKFSVGYFGAYKLSVRNIYPLYNAAKKGKFNLKICGSSDIRLDSTKNIEAYGFVPYRQAVRMEEESDILVCICNSHGTQIPGKIYYCSGHNKPIIVILDGEYKDEIRAYLKTFDRYILCENNQESIMNAIEVAKKQLINFEYRINKQLTPRYMASRILEQNKGMGEEK